MMLLDHRKTEVIEKLDYSKKKCINEVSSMIKLFSSNGTSHLLG